MVHFVAPLLKQVVKKRRDREESMLNKPKYPSRSWPDRTRMYTFKEAGVHLNHYGCVLYCKVKQQSSWVQFCLVHLLCQLDSSCRLCCTECLLHGAGTILLERLQDAHRGLEGGLWKKHPNVEDGCYAPTREPFFLSYDNAPVHSFWLDKKQKQHVLNTGVPLLQLCSIAPKAHDIHLVIEHGIGLTKSEQTKQVHELVEMGVEVGVSEMYDSVMDACKGVDAAFVEKAMVKLSNVLKIVGADKGVRINITTSSGRILETEGTAGGYPPKTAM